MADTGQTGTHAPQSIHSTGSINSMLEPSNCGSSFLGWMQSTGQASTQAASFVPMQGSAITYAIRVKFSVYLLLICLGSTRDFSSYCVLRQWFSLNGVPAAPKRIPNNLSGTATHARAGRTCRFASKSVTPRH